MGFKDVEIPWRKAVFEGAPQASSAGKFGTQGVIVRGRKAVTRRGLRRRGKTMNRKAHWERVYKTKASTELSWYEAHPETSLRLIANVGLDRAARIIDVGGGESLLVDWLLDLGFRNVSVLDVSRQALARAQARLAQRRDMVRWINCDVTTFRTKAKFDLWHDRAAFHFLTDPEDQGRYVDAMRRSLTHDGHLIMATFSLEGPPKCSGLNVVRYSPQSLAQEIGSDFRLAESIDQVHVTPGGAKQALVFCRFVRHAA